MTRHSVEFFLRPVLKPYKEVIVKCSLRVWIYQESGNRSLWIFMHPEEWRHVSLRDGTQMLIQCLSYEFKVLIGNMGEFYRNGRVSEQDSDRILLPPGDYEATARIVWDEAIPELLLGALDADESLVEKWRQQQVELIREQISTIRRAKKESIRVDRQLTLIQELRESK